MLRPLLIIGVGGSGGKTIRSMIQSLERKFVSAGYDGPIPAAWQFLQIDTTRDGQSFPAPMLDKDSFHQVVANGQDFAGMLRSITDTGDISEQQRMLSGWGVPHAAVTIAMGAGQTRAIGRQAGVADSKGMLGALQNSIAKMNAPMAFAELLTLSKALNLDDPIRTPQAMILASVAGGSGAGMFIDVAELLKRATDEKWAKSAISFLYTAEVFTSIGNSAKDTAKNSLGAFNEVMAGKWVGLSDRSEFLYQKLGLAPVADVGSLGFGAKGNILIGARNKAGTDISIGADGAGMDEVFLTIGEALAGVLTDDVTSEWLYQAAFVNVTETKSAIDVSGLAPVSAENPTLAAAGIGFGQLSLGTDRVVDYVADSLTKLQVEKLLWPDLTAGLLVNGVTSQTLIQEKANQLWPNFLIDSGLDEKDSQDQIIDALFPTDWAGEVRAFAKGVAKISVSEKPAPLANYAKNVFAEWDTESTKFLKTIQDKIHANAKAWVPSIQSHMKDHVANQLTQDGFSVVLNLLDRLKNELIEYSYEQLLREGKQKADAVFLPNQTEFLKFVQENAAGLTGVGLQNGQFLEKVEKELAKSLAFRVISHVNNLGASLIQDLVRNFIEPVIKSMSDARYELDKEQSASLDADGKKNPYFSFPKWGSGVVPDRYKPRTIERILIDTSDYESTYEIYAQRDSGGNPPFHQSVTQALLGKKMNPKDGDVNEQSLISSSLPWTTGVREAQDGMGTSVSKVSWSFKTSLQDLHERNRKWLKHRDSAFGKFTTMPIREFLEAEGLDMRIRDERADKFVSEFQAMLALSQPLVLLNENAMRYIKGVGTGQSATGTLTRSSKLPVAFDSQIGRACTTILAGNGENPADGDFMQKWFNPGSNDTSLFAVSTTQASLPAWAFASLTDPILNQVATSKNNSGTWMQFWEGRRARPLVESVPFSEEIRRSIVTGWFMASLFGLREISAHANGRTARVWNPTLETPGWSNFPDPLLDTHPEDANRGNWMLPAILTSAGIALSEFGKTGNPENIDAYKFLLYMGREVTTSIKGRDEWNLPGSGDQLPTGALGMAEFLRDWVMKGTKPADRELLEMLSVRLSAGLERGEAAKSVMTELREQYNQAWSELKGTHWSKMPETWELKDDIDRALEDIFNYVDGLHAVSARTGA
jgi:Tubulin like